MAFIPIEQANKRMIVIKEKLVLLIKLLNSFVNQWTGVAKNIYIIAGDIRNALQMHNCYTLSMRIY